MTTERIIGGHSLFPVEKPELCAYRVRIGIPIQCHRFGRVVECKGDTDTLECSQCGKQWTARCNFDEDFS